MRVPKQPFIFQFKNEKRKTNFMYLNHSFSKIKIKMKMKTKINFFFKLRSYVKYIILYLFMLYRLYFKRFNMDYCYVLISVI